MPGFFESLDGPEQDDREEEDRGFFASLSDDLEGGQAQETQRQLDAGERIKEFFSGAGDRLSGLVPDAGFLGHPSRFASSIADFFRSEESQSEPRGIAQDAARAGLGGVPSAQPLRSERLERGIARTPDATISALPDEESGFFGSLAREATQAIPGAANFLARTERGVGNTLSGIGGLLERAGAGRVGTIENPLRGIGQALQASGEGFGEIESAFPEPRTLPGKALRFGGDIGPEIGSFIALGGAAQSPRVGTGMNILRAAAANAPLDFSIGASGEGGVPAGLELLGDEERARFIRERPLLAGALETGLGTTFEGVAGALLPAARGARRAAEAAKGKVDEFGEFMGRLRLNRRLASRSDIPDVEEFERLLDARLTGDLRPVGEDIRAPWLAARTGQPVEATAVRAHNSELGTVAETVEQSPFGAAFVTDDPDLAEQFRRLGGAMDPTERTREMLDVDVRFENPFVLEEESIEEMGMIVAREIRENPDAFNHSDDVVRRAMAGLDLDEAARDVAGQIDQTGISGPGVDQTLHAMRRAGYDGVISRFGDVMLGGNQEAVVRGVGHEMAILDPAAVRETRPHEFVDEREVPTFIDNATGSGKRPVPKGDMPTTINDAMGRGFVQFADDGALEITAAGRRAGFDGSSLGFADRSIISALARAGVGGAAGGAADVGPLEDVPMPARIGIGMATGLAAPKLMRSIAEPFTRMRREAMEQAAEAITREENEQLRRLVGQGELFPDQVGPIKAIEASIPKDINVPEVVRRITRRASDATRDELRQIFESVDAQVRAGEDLGQVEISNDETLRLARHVGFEPSALKEFEGGEARRQTVAALVEVAEKTRALTELRQLAGRVQGRVSDARWEEIMARMNQLEKEIDVAAGARLRGGSEFGRGLQAQKINIFARETFSAENSSPWVVEARRLSGDKLTADDIAEIQSILREGSVEDMTRFMERMATRGKSWGEKYATLVKAGLLSAPKTDMLNLISTGTHMGLRMLDDATAAIADRLFSLRTGQRSQSVTLDIGDRTMGLWEGLKLGWNGDPELGVQGFKDVMRGGLGRDALIKYDFRGMRTGNRWVDWYIQWGFNRLGAEDAMMKGFAFVNSAQERARVHALNEGLKPGTEAFRGKVNATMSEMPDWLVLNAVADAEMATFTNINKLGTIVNSGKRAARQAGGLTAAASELLVPFVNTLVNVGDAFLRRTPGSFVFREEEFWQPAVKLLTHADDVTQAEQRALARIFAEQGFGLGAVTLGYQLRKKGLTTAAFPEDSDTRNAFIEQNIQPFAISGRALPGVKDDLTIGMENISPMGNLIGLGGQIYDIVNDPEADIVFNDDEPLASASDLDKLAAGQFSAMMHQMSEMTFLANVNSALKAVTDPEVGAERYLEQLARMHVPTILRQTANTLDPTLRRVEGMGDAVRASLPGVSRGLEPKVSGLGGTRQRDPGGLPTGDEEGPFTAPGLRAANPVFGSGIEGLVNPFRIENVRDDPVLTKLSSLNVGIPRLTTAERRDLEGRPRTLVENFYGQNVRAALERLFADPEFQSLPETADEGEPSQRERADNLISSVRSQVTEHLEERGLLPTVEEERSPDPFLQAETGGGGAPADTSGSAFFGALDQ